MFYNTFSIVYYCGFLGVFLLNIKESFADEIEFNLVRQLMANYNPMVRPAENSSQPLLVEFGMSLHHIIDVTGAAMRERYAGHSTPPAHAKEMKDTPGYVHGRYRSTNDEKNQLLTTNCWITQKWTDHHLKWNASEHADIRVIRIPYEHVWRPDIILYNNADPHYLSSVINTNVIVSQSGEVVWLSHGIYVSVCDINVEHFPFDVQICKFKWASWTYDGFQLDLHKESDEGDTTNYQVNGEFELISFKASRHLKYYSCCKEPYPDVTFVIKLKRRPLFYVFNLILPCLLINGIALLVFYVPSVSGEKVTLGISALLSMTVFLMTIRDTLPPTEKMPLISLYYGVSTCLVSFSASLSVVTLNISYKGMHGQPVPPLVRKIFLKKLAKIMFINFDVDKDRLQGQVNPRTGSRLKSEAEGALQSSTALGTLSGEIRSRSQRNPDSRLLSDHQKKSTTRSTEYRTSNLCNPESDCTACPNAPPCNGRSGIADRASATAVAVREVAARHERRVRARERAEQDNLEWKQVSVVVDRALLAIFLLMTIVSTAVILYPQRSS